MGLTTKPFQQHSFIYTARHGRQPKQSYREVAKNAKNKAQRAIWPEVFLCHLSWTLSSDPKGVSCGHHSLRQKTQRGTADNQSAPSGFTAEARRIAEGITHGFRQRI